MYKKMPKDYDSNVLRLTCIVNRYIIIAEIELTYTPISIYSAALHLVVVNIFHGVERYAYDELMRNQYQLPIQYLCDNNIINIATDELQWPLFT